MEEEKDFGLAARIQAITEAWFITEPLMMMTLLSHQLKANGSIKSFRCGKGVIEYNAQYAKFLNREQLGEHLKAEIIRILLRHPYRHHYKKENAYIASNITLNENYQFKELMYRVTDYWNLSDFRGRNFEFYYREIDKLMFSANPNSGQETEQQNSDFPQQDKEEDKNNESNAAKPDQCETPATNSEPEEQQPDEGSNENESDTADQEENEALPNISEPGENSELWQEDDFMDEKIKEIIQWAHENMHGGTLSGNFMQMLYASLRPEIDYRKILSAFRASVLLSNKMLTRFKPSRRYGFLYMGKKNEFTTKLLVAVDVSGSVSTKDLQKFYSTINRFFKYGIQSIDVLQFDCEVKEPLLSLKKAQKDIKILGRGGTDFQPAVDYFEKSKKKYDGLIIFTDGGAPIPNMSARSIRKTLWICDNKEDFDSHKRWMKQHGKCCWIKQE